MKEVDLQVAYGAVKHFGRNLYTSNPPAIAELVANAWDAYAKECTILEKEGKLVIADDGIGMTDSEFTKRYAVSGTEKETKLVRKPDGMELRDYMGRKGIGKFASFSLGEEYCLYTKSCYDSSWKKIKFCYKDLLVNEAIITLPVEHVENLSEVSQLFDHPFDMETGTIIYIPKMKRKFIKSTDANLRNILSRRFSVNITEKYTFDLVLNNESVDLKTHFYDEYVEFIYYFGMDEEDIKKRFPKVEEKFLFSVKSLFVDEHKINGWIGSVREPKFLKIDDELHSTGIIVYINGKLADENILKSVQDAKVSNSYVVGEVNADFLQNETEDPVLSSREGLNMELENVELLKEELSNLRGALTTKWKDLRADRNEQEQDYLVKIIENEKFGSVYNTFNSSQRKQVTKYAQKLFDKSDKDNDAEIEYFTPVIFSIVNSEIIKEIDVRESDNLGTILKKFYNLFDKTEINSALRIKSNIQDRLNVIEELSKHIDDEAKEKVFEKHLMNHPWLINPYWDKASHNVVTSTQEHYEMLVGNNKVEGYADLIIRVAEETHPIICELKREKKTGYSNPNPDAIMQQITTYRRGISIKEEELSGVSIGYNSIKAFFICGDHVVSQMKSRDRTFLEVDNNIKILTYSQIIQGAKGIYSKAVTESI